jgi:ketosteroid isomerase-like protein
MRYWLKQYFLQGGNMNRHSLTPLLIVLSTMLTQAQTGPCTESAVKQGHLPSAEDAFVYMPPYGKPVVGKSAIKEANEKSFSDRTNINSDWVGEHRIVSSPSGDMAYEYGTLQMSSDSKSDPAGHEDFKAVMLMVYKAKGAVCQQVAQTMQPVEERTQH